MNYQEGSKTELQYEMEVESYNDNENDNDNDDDYDEESIPEHLDDIDLLTNAHVEELKVIYYNKSLEEEADKCSLNESQKNDYLSHLNNITCCTDSCL